LPLRKKGNQLLVTILLGVSIANSGISIFLAEAEGNLSGFFISTTLTLIFGEILPQAIATRYTLQVASLSRFLLYPMLYLLYIISFPISAVIDKLIGEDGGTFLSKSQMKKLFEQHEKDKLLNPGERKMLSAALELKTKTIGDVMTPLSKIFMLDINQTLDETLKRTIYEQGYSRIPIYEGDQENIIGILMSRDLILASIDDNLTTLHQLSSIFVREVIAIDRKTKLEPVL